MQPPRAAGPVTSTQFICGNDLPDSVKRRIADGREISFTLPESTYVIVAMDLLRDKILALAPFASPSTLQIFELRYRGIYQTRYEEVVSRLTSFTEEEKNIDGVVRRVYEKIDKQLPCSITKKINDELHETHPTEPYVINLQQAIKLLTLSGNMKEHFINSMRNNTPITTQGKKDPVLILPKIKCKLSADVCDQYWKILEIFSQGIPRDELDASASKYPTSKSGWTVYGSDQDGKVICYLTLKNPEMTHKIVETLNKCKYTATIIKIGDKFTNNVGLLLDSKDFESEQSLNRLRDQAKKAKEAIAQTILHH